MGIERAPARSSRRARTMTKVTLRAEVASFLRIRLNHKSNARQRLSKSGVRDFRFQIHDGFSSKVAVCRSEPPWWWLTPLQMRETFLTGTAVLYGRLASSTLESDSLKTINYVYWNPVARDSKTGTTSLSPILCSTPTKPLIRLDGSLP